MAYAEVALRGLVFILIAAFFTRIFWRLGVRLLSRLKVQVPKPVLAVVSGVLGVVSLFVVLFFYVYYGFGYQPDIYRVGNRTSNKVAITFDDGPSREFTPAILEILREYNVPATFFMVGSHVEKYPDIARQIVEDGHAIGNHTQNHRNLPTLSTVELQKELMEATAIITEITGVYPQYLRPPRGMYDDRTRRMAKLLGQEIVLWSISTRDWRFGVTASYIERLVERQVRGGDIILFHDSGALLRNEGGDRRATVMALPKVIEIIRAKGLEIVPLAELLHDAVGESFPQIDRPE